MCFSGTKFGSFWVLDKPNVLCGGVNLSQRNGFVKALHAEPQRKDSFAPLAAAAITTVAPGTCFCVVDLVLILNESFVFFYVCGN